MGQTYRGKKTTLFTKEVLGVCLLIACLLDCSVGLVGRLLLPSFALVANAVDPNGIVGAGVAGRQIVVRCNRIGKVQDQRADTSRATGGTTTFAIVVRHDGTETMLSINVP